jgi:hypothetical protein
MLTTLSILSLDQGPKWREPVPEAAAPPAPEPEPVGRPLGDVLRALVARVADAPDAGAARLRPGRSA